MPEAFLLRAHEVIDVLMSASGLGRVKTPAPAARIETSRPRGKRSAWNGHHKPAGRGPVGGGPECARRDQQTTNMFRWNVLLLKERDFGPILDRGPWLS